MKYLKLIFFIVIYLLGYFGKLIFSYWIKKVTDPSRYQDNFNQKPEGEVTIDSKPTTKSRGVNNGDYVDYEEVLNGYDTFQRAH